MISVVIPLYNESALVPDLLSQVHQSMQAIGKPFEVVCVDDGSTDNTLDRLLQQKTEKKELRIISLSRNFGLQAALAAGMDHTSGDYVVVMDGDLQDPPAVISQLYSKMKSSKADVVSAVRSKRGERISKRLYINIFHKVFRNVSVEEQLEQAGNFCILSRRAVDAILKFNEQNRYFPGIRNFIGFQHETVEFDRPERTMGQAKMSHKKLFALAADAIYSFSKWPIKACLYLGLLGVVVFLFAIVYTLASKFTGLAPFGWSSTFMAISFFGSVQLTFLGLIGEYIYRIYKEVQKRPTYLIKEIYE